MKATMTIPHHDPAELMAATDWGIDGTLLDADGQPLDLSNATLNWTVIGPAGTPGAAERRRVDHRHRRGGVG